jgi:endonuclease/exonuclease/phosphatase family metal-dependent hydrolase
MLSPRWIAAATFLSLFAANLSGKLPAAEANADGAQLTDPGTLSVMTYNVKGLPFPAAFDRTEALQEIGLRLARLRKEGRQPHVVLLQEAFSAEAKAIGRLAGYRHIALGPQPADVGAADVMPAAFHENASWLRGETQGKWIDSGLVILSDYSILKTSKHAFSRDACAGFDCLSSKGVLLAWLSVPGRSDPVVIGNTHLNSRKATGVRFARANSAFAIQLRELRQFVAQTVAETSDIVVGGDFNIGNDADRIRAVESEKAMFFGTEEATDAYRGKIDPDLDAVRLRSKDKQYFRSGPDGGLLLRSLSVPFGKRNGGAGLSDHLGYIAEYDWQ